MKRFKTLRSKLLFQNGLLFFAAFMLTTLIISYFSTERIRKLEFQSNETYLSHTQHTIDLVLKNMAQVTMYGYTDRRIETIMVEYSSYDENRQNEARDYLFSLVYSLMYLKPELKAVYIFDTENLIYGYDLARSTNIRLLQLAQEPWYKALHNPSVNQINNCVLIGAHEPMFLSRRSYEKDPLDYYCIAIAREIKRFKPHETMGYMLILSPVRTLQAVIDQNADPEAEVYLVDDLGNIIYERSGTMLGMPLETMRPALYGTAGIQADHTNYRTGGTEYLVSSVRSGYSGWTLITMRESRTVFQQTSVQTLLNVAIGIGVLLISILLMNILIKHSLKSLKALSTGMQNAIQRDFRSGIAVSSEDEISKLSTLFNQMMDTINTLIYSEYEATIRMRDMALEQKEYQIKLLRHQINPHFLYNTLDTLRMKALINGDQEVAEMALEMADFFRKAVSMDSMPVKLQTEIDFLQLYISLMRKRYKNLAFHCEVDASLAHELVPNFILQPIAENCMIHGLKELRYQGEISLRAYPSPTQAEDFFVDISDNGMGMDTRRLDALNEMLENIDGIPPGQRDHLGLDNVQRRLRQYYPEGYGIHVISSPGISTTVSIRCKKTKGL